MPWQVHVSVPSGIKFAEDRTNVERFPFVLVLLQAVTVSMKRLISHLLLESKVPVFKLIKLILHKITLSIVKCS
jgi:hypothetical protein